MRSIIRRRFFEENVDTGTRVFPQAFDFEEPGWWTSMALDAEWGEPVCAYGSEEQRGFLITTKGFVLLQPGLELVRFSSISDYDLPEKHRAYESLVVRTSEGLSVEMPLLDGDPFTFVRFLGSVAGEAAE